jgi:O-antigen/teichoic acid export membrane protein
MKVEIQAKIKKILEGFSTHAQDLIKTLGTNLVLAATSVGTGILVARLLGPEKRGALAAAMVWPLLFQGLGAFGLPQAVVYFAGRNHRDPGGVAGTALALGGVQALLVPAAGFLLMPWLLQVQGEAVIANARWYLLAIFAGFLGSYPMFVLQGLARMSALNALRLITPISYLIFLLVLMFVGIRSPKAVILVLVGLSFLQAGVNIIGTKWLVNSKGRLERGLVRPLLTYGCHSWLSTIPIMLNSRLDQLLMTLFLPAEQLGFYVVAVSWSACLQPLAGAFATVAFPRIAQSQSPSEGSAILTRNFQTYLILNSLLAAVALVVTPLAIKILFGASYSPAIPSALLLVVGGAALGMNYVLSDSLRGLGLPLGAAFGEVIGLGLTIILLLLLLRPLGIIGAALASCLAYFGTFAGLVWYTCRRTDIMAKNLFHMTWRDLHSILSMPFKKAC